MIRTGKYHINTSASFDYIYSIHIQYAYTVYIYSIPLLFTTVNTNVIFPQLSNAVTVSDGLVAKR